MLSRKVCTRRVPAYWLAMGIAIAFSNLSSAQSCSNNCTRPPSTNYWWAPNTTITVYIDPLFQQTEQNAIQSAVEDWFKQSSLTTNNISYAYAGADPGPQAQNVIRVVNDPLANRLAVTSPGIVIVNGTPTNQMWNATISFNRNFMLDQVTPAYAPQNGDAEDFLTGVFHHELGHVFGEWDTPAPTDPTTGKPNPCLQTPDANVMNGYCGTNDEDGGIQPASITPCDNYVVTVKIAVGGTVRSNLSAEYVLWEDCGTDVYDSSVNALNGTLVSGVWIPPGVQFSDQNNADGVQLPDAVLGTDDVSVVGFTIEFWVNVDPESYSDYFASFSNSGISLYQRRWDGNDSVEAWINGQDTSVGIANLESGTWSPGVWEQVVVVRSNDGSTVSTYLNGILSTSQAVQNNVPVGLDVNPTDETVSAGPKVIGGTVINYDNPSFTGTMGEMRIYSTGLTGADILANFNFRRSSYGM